MEARSDSSRENLIKESTIATYQSISKDATTSEVATSDPSGNSAPDFDKDVDYAATGRPKARIVFNIVLVVLAVLAALSLVVLYGVVPACFYWSSVIRRTFFFSAFNGGRVSLADPEVFGLNCSRSYFVPSDPAGVRLGTWYVQSQAVPCTPHDQMFPDASIKTVLYLHGISFDRSARNRVKIMQVLSSEVKVHAVSFDYRGFGDSTNELPSVQSVVNDSLALYKSLRATIPRENIVVWGHSMGTAAAVYLAAELHRMNESPAAIVLEAAFDDVAKVAKVSSKLKIWRPMPCFDAIFVDTIMDDPATAFNSTAKAADLDPRVPVLMLHSEDDPTIPMRDGLHLHNAILEARKDFSDPGTVSMVLFNSSFHFGHNRIPFYAGLPDVVERFLNGTLESSVTEGSSL